MGLFGNSIWYEWDAVFRFYPLDALLNSISAITTIGGEFAVQNAGVPGAVPVYGLQYLAGFLGISIVQANRLVYVVPWLCRGVGMYFLLSQIETSESRAATLGKFMGALLYQFAPLGEPFSSNISSVTAGSAPVMLGLFIRGTKSSRWILYAMGYSLFFALAISTGYSIVFIPVVTIAYSVVTFPKSGAFARKTVYLITCFLFCGISAAYFFVPYFYSVLSNATVFGNISGSFNSPATISNAAMQSIVNIASKNAIQYNAVGLLEGVWGWGPAYLQPWVYVSLAATSVIAYSAIITRRERASLFFVVLGLLHVLFLTTLTYPLLSNVFLFGFHYFNTYFINPVYLLYGLWLAVAALFGLAAEKLLQRFSGRKQQALAVALIVLVLLDSYPVLDGAMINSDVSPTTGFPLPADYLKIHDELSSAPPGERLLELPAINLQYNCSGQSTGGFTWADGPGCFTLWGSRLVPPNVEVAEYSNDYEAIGYGAIYQYIADGNVNSPEAISLLQKLNIHYILVHKDLLDAPSWLNNASASMLSGDNFRLIVSNEYFDIFQTSWNTMGLYATQLTSLAPNIVGYWKLNEGAGTIARDSSPNNNSAKVIGSPDWLAGSSCPSMSCMNFDGASNYLLVPDSSSLRLSTGFTLGLWVKLNSCNQNAISYMMGKGSSGSNNWSFILSQHDCVPEVVYFDGSGNQGLSASVALSVGQWHFLEATWDGGLLQIFEDGGLVGLTAAPKPPVTSSDSMAIGARDDASDYCSCSIGEPFVLNVALTPNELTNLYQESSSGSDLKSSLAVFYRSASPALNESQGLTLEPSTMSQWHGRFDFAGPTTVVLTQLFSDQWKASLDGRTIPSADHILVDGYANGWVLNATDNGELTIEDMAQPYFNLGLAISGAFWSLCIAVAAAYFLLPFVERRLGREHHTDSTIDRNHSS